MSIAPLRLPDAIEYGGGLASTPGYGDPGPIVVLPQPLEPFLTDSLDAVARENLPDLSFSGHAPAPRLSRELADCGFGPPWLAEWLVDNVVFQKRLITELTRLPVRRIRLETIVDDACCRFHTDNVAYRLLCTYRGPGTEWIEPKAMAHHKTPERCGPEAIRSLERGAIAIVRGAQMATAARPALMHRSPPITGTSMTRLLLVIDVEATVGRA